MDVRRALLARRRSGAAASLRDIAPGGAANPGSDQRVGERLREPEMDWMLSMSIRMTALSPIMHGREVRILALNSDALLLGIRLAAAAWATMWALKEAVTTQSNLEEYV